MDVVIHACEDVCKKGEIIELITKAHMEEIFTYLERQGYTAEQRKQLIDRVIEDLKKHDSRE